LSASFDANDKYNLSLMRTKKALVRISPALYPK
jgi:hypothetical protein